MAPMWWNNSDKKKHVGGTSSEDELREDGSYPRMTAITVGYNSHIMSLRVLYDNKDGQNYGHPDSAVPKKDTLKLGKKEYLIGVSGHYSQPGSANGGPPRRIRSLTLTRNNNKNKSYGVQEGEAFDLTCANVQIVGFHVRGSPDLESIGVIYHRDLINILKGKTNIQAFRPRGPQIRPDSALGKFGSDLTEKAKARKLDPVIGRSNEIDSCIEILCKRSSNNPLLIGEAGVGKTVISHGIAQKIADKDVPDLLKERRLISLDVNALIDGRLEKLKDVVEEVSKSNRHILLFIDEIHLLLKAETATGSDAANILKPMLAEGKLSCIGATTFDEYRKYIEKDRALVRRFETVEVDQSSVEYTVKILQGLCKVFEEYHGVTFSEPALQDAAKLSDRYITNKLLPSKAIAVIDRAASKVKLRVTNDESDTIKRGKRILHDIQDIKRLKHKMENDDMINLIQPHTSGRPVNNASFKESIALSLERELQHAKDELNKVKVELKESNLELGDEVTAEDIASVVSEMTKIPLEKLTESESEQLLQLGTELHKRVVGQEHAVEAVVKAVQRSRVVLGNQKRPTASFMFMGPTGVGKTELAKALAYLLFNTEEALVRFDMSAYKEKHAVSRLLGSPPGYKQHEEGGQLTEAIRRRPYSVILFDEIEKAHPELLEVLLPILDEGKIKDAAGRLVNFTNTVIIMTSNVGSKKILSDANDNLPYENLKKNAMEAARSHSHFKPEFINRIDEFLVFLPLSIDQIEAIVALQLEELEKRYASQREMKIQATPDAIKLLANLEDDDKQYGARPVRRVILDKVEDQLVQRILRQEFQNGDTISIGIESTSSSSSSSAQQLSFQKLN
ncbi:chaperone protein ClpB3, chloroplastic-like [Arachis stenosperma]|uniref:chaperone protein ClpB3, chloroplastic-like n=1 Tax=Arachis stenosperma TaxID=217475 RepID=UPI0025AC5880|nr:chaperone protein ClpB3, chloroplastic-like [Arachis stenosperma]XP_057754800.1 chaperone protein ClpB3, chloroplastic-like [Arachis stenosperma]